MLISGHLLLPCTQGRFCYCFSGCRDCQNPHRTFFLASQRQQCDSDIVVPTTTEVVVCELL